MHNGGQRMATQQTTIAQQTQDTQTEQHNAKHNKHYSTCVVAIDELSEEAIKAVHV